MTSSPDLTAARRLGFSLGAGLNAALRLIPTAALLTALAERDGVQSYDTPRGGQREFCLVGPAREGV